MKAFPKSDAARSRGLTVALQRYRRRRSAAIPQLAVAGVCLAAFALVQHHLARLFEDELAAFIVALMLGITVIGMVASIFASGRRR
jgi:hypothetical protein